MFTNNNRIQCMSIFEYRGSHRDSIQTFYSENKLLVVIHLLKSQTRELFLPAYFAK
jgi:hypothetical protein